MSMVKSLKELRKQSHDFQLLVILIAVISLAALVHIIIRAQQAANLIDTNQQQLQKIVNLREKITEDTNGYAPEKWKLFGQAGIANNLANSYYQLLGIQFTKQQPQQARAIISTDGDEAIYKVGDKLPQGAIVQAIESERVILLINGERSVLTLIWQDEDF